MISGRTYEREQMINLLKQKESHLLAIIGRRRVGKTFLIRETYAKNLVFSITGIKDASKSQQLKNFALTYNEAMGLKVKVLPPQDWQEAFSILKEYISSTKSKYKKVVFFDEFPWLASPRSGFIQAFDHFWNTWAVQNNIVVVICGSAATWMIQKVINNKGGLHNRVTAKLNLQPFTLKETQEYFIDNGIKLPLYEIVSIYMVLGGIPYYLRNVSKGESAIQSIDKICFGKNAILSNEFDNLYKALFTNYQDHIDVIKTLAKKRKGLTRSEILEKTNLNSGGSFTLILQELEGSSFISSYRPFGKKERDTIYRLTDEYSLFYLSFLNEQQAKKGTWQKIALSQKIKSWSGYTFESICYKHIESIKVALGIEGIQTNEYSLVHKGNDEKPGFQIDLLIDRADNSINLCEAKYYNKEYLLTEAEAKKLRVRKSLFESISNTKKQIITTLITTYGLIENKHSHSIDKLLTIESLFIK
jgi:AAA+ ATPase superfamily predicted ATPase